MLGKSPSLSRNRIFSIFIVLILLLSVTVSQAQVRGIIAGRVTDASTGGYLPGANVFLEGTTIGAATDREGSFVILNVPEGVYQVRVGYIGYDDYTQEVEISGSQRKVVMDDIPLQLSAMETDVIVVEGQLEGQMKALNQQRVAANIKNVVAREQMELFPDYTVADAVRRLPGVFVDRDQGEGRYVLIRGTEPRLSNVKVNGEELATNRVEERYSQLDIVGSNQVASIEVVKALTPDMDGDAIGGTVNLITRKAFDYSGQRLRATVSGGYGDLRGNPLYQGKLSYSNIFGANRNLGLSVTANWDRTDKGAHNKESDYSDETAEDGGLVRGGFALSELTLRDYYNIRDRYGFGATLQYRLDESNRFYIDGMYNRLNDDQSRGRKELDFRGDWLDSQGLNHEGLRMEIRSDARVEQLIQQSFSAGGDHQFDLFALDYKIAYNYAEETHPDQLESRWRLDDDLNLRMDYSDPQFPKWQQTNIDDIGYTQWDAEHYRFREMDYRDTFASDQNIVGAVNFKLPFTLAANAGDFKLGGKLRIKEKDRNDKRWGYSWEGAGRIYLNQLVSDKDTKDFLKGNYRYGPQPDVDKVQDFFNTYRDRADGLVASEDIWDTYGQTYLAKENIYAGYAMGTLNFTDLTVLLGLRYEHTVNDYTGTVLRYNDQGVLVANADTTGDRTYGFAMPSLHLKYELGRMSNIRFAVTRTLARPNYWDLVPYSSLDYNNKRIRKGNPDLKITESWNLDFMGEHYFTGVGVISGGLFYKDIKNFSTEIEEDIDNPNSPFDNWEFRGPVNAGDAQLYGVEVNWWQQLNFLPGYLAGLGIYANYTHTWIKSDLTYVNPFQQAKTILRKGFDELPGQAGDVGNLALSYEWGPFSGRFSVTYQDKFLLEPGGADDGSQDLWRDSQLTLDLSASYKIIPELDLFTEFVNLGDEPEIDYRGKTERPYKIEYYGWWMRAGLRLSL